MKPWAAVLLSVTLTACAAPAFNSDIRGGPTPWTHARFDNAPEDFAFAFAVVADLESGYRDGVFDKTGAIPAGGAKLCLDHGGPACPAPQQPR